MAHIRKEMISFYLTTKCNLNCSYCYTKQKSGFKHQTLDFEFAKLGMEDYFQKGMKRHIRFFGPGEPTCEFELMKKIKDYAYNTVGDDLSVEIQTNGIFGQHVREWLSENVDIIWISSDGVPELHDLHRRTVKDRPTSKKLAENVRYLIQNGKGMTGIRSTITSANVYKQKDNIEYFSGLGVKHIWSDPIFPSVGEKQTSDSIDMIEYAKEFLKAKEFADKNDIFYGSILTCNFDEKVIYNCRACIPVPHLTTDGYISACDMALFGEDKNHMSIFIYGRWDKNNNKIIYDQNKISMLRSRSADNMPGCKNCSAKNNCAGYCLGEVTNETGNMFGKKTKVCDPIRFLLKNLTPEQCKYEYSHP